MNIVTRVSVACVAATVMACGPQPAATSEIRSGSFPAVVIECRAEITIGEDVCRAWGEKLLRGTPDLAVATQRLVLTYRGGTARCAADFYRASGGSSVRQLPSVPSSDQPCPVNLLTRRA